VLTAPAQSAISRCARTTRRLPPESSEPPSNHDWSSYSKLSLFRYGRRLDDPVGPAAHGNHACAVGTDKLQLAAIVDRRQRYANGELERNRRNEGSAICDRLRGSGMRDRGSGRIVAISSMAGRMGNADKVAYTAAKAGLQGMIRTVAIENCALGITANCVLPGSSPLRGCWRCRSRIATG
jgi:hypothetical protein